LLQKNVVFLTQNVATHGATHVGQKLCILIHYNVQYMVFIVIYIILKLQENTVTYMFCYNLMSTCVVWGKVTAVGVLNHNFQ